MTSMLDLHNDLLRRLAEIDGAAISDGAFAPGPAVWVGTREVAHFDADGTLDVRLTRQVIRQRRHDLSDDQRFALRRNTSDWVEMRMSSWKDVTDAVALVEVAVAANRSTAQPGPPPEGADLQRRRRFH